MKHWPVLFVILLGMCAVLAIVLFGNEPPNGHGVEHPDLPAIQQGGTPDRHADLMWLGGLYGVLQIAFFTLSLMPGLRPGGRGRNAFLFVGFLCIVAFLSVLISYQHYADAEPLQFILGFPPSTALMLFVLWPIPVLCVVLYTTKFNEWVLNADDRRRFEKLLTQRTEDAQE